MANNIYQLNNLKNGFTLIEAVISILILAIVIVATASALITNPMITSYSKHRIQAVYLAKQTLEDMRKHNYGDLTSASSYVNNLPYGTGAVCIDVTDYANGVCGLWGNRIVTVNNVTGDIHRRTAQFKVSWSENIGGVVRSMQEYCTTDIADTAAPN